MDTIVKESIESSRKGGVCRICNRSLINYNSNNDDSTLINDNLSSSLIISHYQDCLESFQSELNRLISSSSRSGSSNDIIRKRKKIDSENGYLYRVNNNGSITPDIRNNSTNHYFKDSLLRVSLVSILKYEDDNSTVMNLLMTCKDSMQWKDMVIFPRLPPLETINFYKGNSRIHELPKKYARVYINDDKEWDYFRANSDDLITYHCTEMFYNIDEEITPGSIPSHFTRIHLGEDFDRSLSVGSIPPFTTHLYLGDSYNQDLYKALLPETLVHLEVPYIVNISKGNLEDLLPDNIETLSIPIYMVGPYLKNLKHLFCLSVMDIEPKGDDQPEQISVRHLPNTIRYLDLNDCIIKDGALPSGVKYLKINLSLNHHQFIPSSVTHLYAKYTEETVIIKGMIPSTVTELELDEYYTLSEECIPSSVTTLSLMNLRNNPPNGAIPGSVVNLFLRGTTQCQFDGTKLPNSIEYFGIQDDCDFPLKGIIPPSTKYFDYQNTNLSHVKFYAKDIPMNVTRIRLGTYFDSLILPGFIPEGCKYLEMPENYNQSIPRSSLPKSLKTISVNPSCYKLDESIPSSIRKVFSNEQHTASEWYDTYPGYWKMVNWHMDI